MAKKYTYNGTEYNSTHQVRQAIWENEHKIFGSPESNEDWEVLGVSVSYSDNFEYAVTDISQLKEMKLITLDGVFNAYRKSSDTFLVSSLGFRVNANVTAFDNVSGLVAQLQFKTEKGEENPQVGFMTFDDELVMLDLEKMKTLQVEISENGSNVYAQKWALRQTILAAENAEDLSAIDIKFIHTDFTAEA